MTSVKEMTCRICKNSEKGRAFQVREMMFGLRENFTYFECSQCGCLQIADIPKELTKYYPSDYCSFDQSVSESPMKRYLRIRRDRYTFFGIGIIGKLVCKRFPNDLLKMIAVTGTTPDSEILDVGCGSGRFLFSLRDLGFKNLTGIDPFARREFIADDIRVMRKTIHDLPDNNSFDLIVFNHSLEHIPDQLETLSKVSHILADGGVCFVRMPVKTETIWKLYGVDWVQIDAPRHLFVHTIASFRYLSREAGLQVKSVLFDSTAFLFCGSERYKNDIPLAAKVSCGLNPIKHLSNQNQIRKFRRMAAELNTINQGDQAIFCLAHNPE